MAEQIGYVSSFLVSEGVGFIRRADDPEQLVLFHRSAVDDDVVDDIAEGLEVAFELDPDAAAEGGWPVVSKVTAPTPDPAASP